MAKISVIVPVYKVEAFFQRCVDSILTQSFRDFELILVDDGSPDRCGEICDRYAEQDGRVQVIHQLNGGLSAARNAGIDRALAGESQYLTFVDSDDWVHGEYLARLYSAARETDCRIAAAAYFLTGGEPLPEIPPEQVRILDADEFYCGCDAGMVVVAWCKLYHRELFQNLRFPAGKLHEDEFTTYRAVYAAGRVAVRSEPLYAYYQNPDGIMKSKWSPRKMDVLDAFEERIRFAREKGYAQLRDNAVTLYIGSAREQLKTVQQNPDWKAYAPILRRRLRRALAIGRQTGAYPLRGDALWNYELAYPAKPLWQLLHKVKALIRRPER